MLLLTFLFVAALPGSALFLRVYENSLVHQTEAELVAQSAARAAAAAIDWPDANPRQVPQELAPEPPSIDLRMTHILPERPEPQPQQDRRIAQRSPGAIICGQSCS